MAKPNTIRKTLEFKPHSNNQITQTMHHVTSWEPWEPLGSLYHIQSSQRVWKESIVSSWHGITQIELDSSHQQSNYNRNTKKLVSLCSDTAANVKLELYSDVTSHMSDDDVTDTYTTIESTLKDLTQIGIWIGILGFVHTLLD